MIIKPIYIMKEIFGLLSGAPEIFLHSIFENSFNIKINKIIVNISANTKILPPYGIILNRLDFLYLKKEIDREKLEMKITEDQIQINNILLSIQDKDGSYSSNIRINDHIISRSMVDSLKAYIILFGKENGFDIDNEEILNNMLYGQESNFKEQAHISAFVDKLKQLRLFFKNDKGDLEIVKYFLGRGRGLTPSGDDFLVGTMAILYSMELYRTPILKIRALITKNIGVYTNDISEQFLLLATEGKFSSNIIELIEMLNNREKNINAINDVLKYGGTSGTDIMLGIIWGILLTNK